jgi:glycosyltransferase involved in cell wall biosynthesis
VHASTDPEPFGLVIAEAMACGKPVVASRAGGAVELTEPGVNSLAHAPGDARALARCIADLVSNPELRERLGQAGLITARQRYTRTRMAQQMTGIYESLRPA